MSEQTSCVVTGAARGIGRAIAERMVALGHQVVITDIDGEAAERTAAEIGAAVGLAQDVREPESHFRTLEVALQRGRLAVWFNNAGVGFDGMVATQPEEKIRGLVEVNLLGVIWGTRAALSGFERGAQGKKQRGDIINTASLSAFGPVPGLAVYGATKAATVSISMSTNIEAPRGVRVHALCPDGVATQMVADMDDDGIGKHLVNSSGGELITPEEMAEAAEKLIGSRRVVKSTPTWRGGIVRYTGMLPSTVGPSMKVFAAYGRRVTKKRAALK